MDTNPQEFIDAIYRLALEKQEKRCTQNVQLISERIMALLDIQNVARSELEARYLSNYLAIVITSNPARFNSSNGLLVRGSLRLSYTYDVVPAAGKRAVAKDQLALVMLMEDGNTSKLVWKGDKGIDYDDAAARFVQDLRELGEKESFKMVDFDIGDLSAGGIGEIDGFDRIS